jgi:hypothetical protein
VLVLPEQVRGTHSWLLAHHAPYRAEYEAQTALSVAGPQL